MVMMLVVPKVLLDCGFCGGICCLPPLLTSRQTSSMSGSDELVEDWDVEGVSRLIGVVLIVSDASSWSCWNGVLGDIRELDRSHQSRTRI